VSWWQALGKPCRRSFSSSGKDYIDSTDGLDSRARDRLDGRDRRGATLTRMRSHGRKYKKQKGMNDGGGKDGLDGKRN